MAAPAAKKKKASAKPPAASEENGDSTYGPKIGDMVHYYRAEELEPNAAVVTVVYDGNVVDLDMFNGAVENAGPKARVEFSEEPKSGHWTWRRTD